MNLFLKLYLLQEFVKILLDNIMFPKKKTQEYQILNKES